MVKNVFRSRRRRISYVLVLRWRRMWSPDLHCSITELSQAKCMTPWIPLQCACHKALINTRFWVHFWFALWFSCQWSVRWTEQLPACICDVGRWCNFILTSLFLSSISPDIEVIQRRIWVPISHPNVYVLFCEGNQSNSYYYLRALLKNKIIMQSLECWLSTW